MTKATVDNDFTEWISWLKDKEKMNNKSSWRRQGFM